MRGSEQAIQARICLAQHQPEEALAWLEPHLSPLEASGHREKLIEFHLLQALAYDQQNNMTHSSLALQQALTLAEPGGYVRLFVDEGKPMAALLSHLLSLQQQEGDEAAPCVTPTYLRALLCCFGKEEDYEDQQRNEDARSALVGFAGEDLTQREMDVLRWAVTGMKTADIAEQLIMASETVKWHMKHIYSKLEVTNRAQLVVKVQRLGLS